MAAVTSAWYTSKFHRSHYLDSSFRALSEARATDIDADANLYLLRPFGDKRFTESQLAEIDEEIDTLAWSLRRVDVNVQPFDNEDSIVNAILQNS